MHPKNVIFVLYVQNFVLCVQSLRIISRIFAAIYKQPVMDKDEIAIILITVVINAMIILCFCWRHRREVRKKNRYIFRQIHEQEDLKRKLERTCIEKEVLENCLKNAIGRENDT